MKRILSIAGFPAPWFAGARRRSAGDAALEPDQHHARTDQPRPVPRNSHGFKVSSKHPTDVVVLTTTISPGGSTGWHTHPGPAFIVVIRGTLTVYHGNDPTCTPHRHGPGTGFLDPGFGHVHIARNEGATPVTVVQTYLNVPPGGSPRIDAPHPATARSRTNPAEADRCWPPPTAALMVRPGQADMHTDPRPDRLPRRRDDDELADADPDSSHSTVTGMPGWPGVAAPACSR